MIQIQCPGCRKIQPETEMMINSALTQTCAFCGIEFQINVEKNRAAQETLSGRIVSKGLLDVSSEGFTFKVEPKIRTLFAFFIFFVDPLVHYSRLPRPFLWVAVFCAALGTVAGMLAGSLGYSEILTSGGAGFFAGLVLGLLKVVLIGGGLEEGLKEGLPIFGLYSISSLMGGIVAWFLTKNRADKER